MTMVGEPLAGCVMVITADRRKRELASALERRGATIQHAAALSTIPHLDDERLVEATRALIERPPQVVVATTGIGFRGWIEAADAVLFTSAPGAQVGPHAVEAAINRLRDNAGSKGIIRTVVKRGYALGVAQ